ncbi:MAG: hypothetical protein M3O82_08985, partial [Verrucomicrobiota bacterium]|nr:hypothetical protein [Verrucomicrobiota bacterium]
MKKWGIFIGFGFLVGLPFAWAGQIQVTNLDVAPYPDRMVFSRIGSLTSPPPNEVHDRASLKFQNTGSTPLQITGFSFSGPWALSTPVTLPFSIAPGGQTTIQIVFQSASVRNQNGSLTIQSDDPISPNKLIELAGFWQSLPENDEEPSVPELAALFGYNFSVVGPNQALSNKGQLEMVGDEVLSSYWVRAAPASPVSVRQLDAFHSQNDTATIYWYPQGSPSSSSVIGVQDANDAQTVFPRAVGSTSVMQGSFNPSGSFGLHVDSEWSDPALTSHTADLKNGGVEPVGHHVRFWPVRDRLGLLMPNTWFMAMDYSGINYDFNDNVYLITNMRPLDPNVDPNIGGLYPGSPKLVLDFNAAYPNSLTDSTGATTGFTLTQHNKFDITQPSPSSSYTPSLLKIDSTGQGTLTVTTSAGTNDGTTDNDQTNALELPFDGRTAKFNVSARLLGSLSNVNSGTQQAGVLFGVDQDNYIKFVVINRAGVPVLRFYSEKLGSQTAIGADVPLNTPATLQSLELMLVCDAKAGTINAAYHAVYPGNDAGVITLPTGITLATVDKNRFFVPKSKAGIITSNKNGATLNFVFDQFAISSGETTAVRTSVYRINVAGPSYLDSLGNTWSPDTGYFTPSNATAENGGSPPPSIDNTVEDTIYQTYRADVG